MRPLLPEMIVYAVNLTEDEAWDLEIDIIGELKARGHNLLNISDGGEMTSIGLKRSDEARRKMSESRRGKGNQYTYGYKFSDETRRKISLGHLGKKRTPEHNKNLSIALKKKHEERRQAKILAEMWR